MFRRTQAWYLRQSLLAAVAAAAPLCATAQGDSAAGAAPRSGALEEILITARRVEESLQDVPVAVSAVTGDQIDRAFISDTTALAQFAPNVVLDKVEAGTAGGAAFSIRGVSYQDVEKAFDPTVLVFVDDVALGSGTGNVMNLLDVERIEILRGPQGTLFGKNAVGGIVSIHRRKPQLGTLGAKVRATAGNYETQNVEAFVNIGGENAAIKLTGARLDHDGYFRNRTLGEDEDERTEERFGAHVLWQPAEAVTLELQADHLEQDGTPNPVLNISDRAQTDGSGDLFCFALGQCSPGEGEAQSGDAQVSVTDHKGNLELDVDTYIAHASWDISDEYQLTYIGAYLDSFDDTDFDFDGSPAPLYSARKPADYDQTSHELRITRTGDVFTGQAGIYFWDADSFSVNYGPSLVDRAWAQSDSSSIYGEGDFRLGGGTVLTAGFRYIEEEKELEKYVDDGQGNASIPQGTVASRTDEDTIWRLGLRYEFDSGDMVYASYSTGFRSGGFSPRAATVEVLQRGQDPETLANYEIGAKTRWFDQRLQLNAALFHMVYEDMQIEVSLPSSNPGNPQQQGFDNVGKAIIDGIELDMLAEPVDGLTLSATVGLLDAEYDSFTADLYDEGTPRDFSDLDLRRAPGTSYSVAIDYERPIGPGMASAHAGYNWRADYEGTLNNHPGTGIDAFGLLDASLGYDLRNWRFALFGRNMTDEDAFSHTFAVVPNAQGGSLWKFATPRMPRTYGLQVTYEFGD